MAHTSTTPPRPASTALATIKTLTGAGAGSTILDAGCGGGALAAQLAALGCVVTGIDPLPQAIEAARALVPACRFEIAGAQAMPFADGSFDLVVFSNALHHVPQPLMQPALLEALRVSRGPVLVIEPLAEGPFFAAMRPIEDETQIRAEAQNAIMAAASAGLLRIDTCIDYDDQRRFADIDGFLAKVIAADPARRDTALALRDEVSALAAPHIVADGSYFLPQPHRAHLLRQP